MSVTVFPTFADIFPGHSVPTLDDVLSRTSSLTLLRVAAFLNFKLRYTHGDIVEQEKVFFSWIGIFDMNIRINILKNYQNFKQRNEKDGIRVTLFNSIALLKLMERVVWLPNELPVPSTTTPEQEMVFMEAWLICSSTFGADFGGDKEPTLYNLFREVVVFQAKQYEYVERKNLFSQILYSKALFEYLSEDEKCKNFLDEFLCKKQLTSYEQYLRALVEINIMNGGETFSFNLNDENKFLESLFDSMALPLGDKSFINRRTYSLADPDFKIFRTYPLAKNGINEYFILHYNFFIDKLYKGLIFDFYKGSSISTEYSDLPSFLQKLGSAFAEKKIFYSNVVGCFRSKSFVLKVPGDKFKDIEYSDFYVREGNCVFLFEFKNVLVSANVKQSGSFETINKEVIKKLVINDLGKPKGVSQLINVINKLIDKPFYFDDYIIRKIRKLSIYPVLVVTDEFFSIYGIEKIVNDEFQQRSEFDKGHGHKISPVTLLHIDDLIRLQLSPTSNKTQFKTVLDTFHERRKSLLKKKNSTIQDVFRRHQSFDDTMSDVIGDGFDMMLDRLTSALKLDE